MPTQSPLRVGLVGLGDIGVNHHLPAVLRHPGIALVAVADTSGERRTAAASLLADTSVQILERAEQLLDLELDAVILATPPWVTPGLAAHALRAGLYVLAEKPVATDSDGRASLEELSPELLRRYQLGLTYRHDAAIHRLRELFREGRFGPGPCLVRASIYDEARRPDEPEHADRIAAALGHGAPHVHEGAHVFDWLSFILGRGATVSDVWSLKTDASFAAPNLVGARLSYGTDVTAMVEYGWLTDAQPASEITFLTDTAFARLELESFDLVFSDRNSTTTFHQHASKMRRCFDAQLDSFVELATGVIAEPSIGLAAGLATLDLADAITSRINAQSGVN
jgi:myo-inositol 2-dehydrogenase / D-chiro-inositol 1-dehydrogenase